MFLIDSHCHLSQLNYKDNHIDVSDVLSKAFKKGVKLVLSVSVNLEDYENMTKNIGIRRDVLFSCGVHPISVCSIKDFDYNRLNNFASDNNVVAIGETGLDYYHNKDRKDIQKAVFKKHIVVAKKFNKPLIVHSRNAIEDVLTLLRKEDAEKCGGVLHCFSEDINIARILLNMNFYVSFSGMVTFRDSHDIIKQTIRYIPLDYMLLETDSPYLTPVPYRGKENQPAYIYDIAKYIADIKNIELDELASITTSNFYQLFHIL